MSMLSSLDALEDSGTAPVPRAGVFQPKVKARVRKGGSRDDGASGGSVKPTQPAPVAEKTSALPTPSTGNVRDVCEATAEVEVSEPSVRAAEAVTPVENDSASIPVNQTEDLAPDVREGDPAGGYAASEEAKTSSPQDSVPVESAQTDLSPPAGVASKTVAETSVPSAAQESQNDISQESCMATQELSRPVAVRSSFPVPSSTPSSGREEGLQEHGVAVLGEPSSRPSDHQEGEPTVTVEPSTSTKLKKSARKSKKKPVEPVAPDVPKASSKEAVDADLEETLVSLEDNVFASYAMQEDGPLTRGRKRKRAFPHSTSRPKGPDKEAKKPSKASRLECDLSNPSALPLREVIRRAENIERKKAKAEMARKSALDKSKPKEIEAAREPTPPRDVLSLAPQVQVINGRIVVNEQSLTVGAYATSTQDLDQYTRVEEKASRLNYGSYLNRTSAERWKPEETDLFYKAIRQFGTDFELITNLFPTRTRRQIKAKYKKEEAANPRRMSDALTYRPKDQSHYAEMMSRLNMEDLVQDTSDPFGSILAYTVNRAGQKSESRENAEADDTQAEQEVLATAAQ
ncbi:hypothetical protein R1sor_010963 [Riccia sorocarpa]|uniref:SANT domain-containing protein n=1 Tax=Riccia sorocarpa TaxID=122646 RepID=A0ABD3HZJ0_9MARC